MPKFSRSTSHQKPDRVKRLFALTVLASLIASTLTGQIAYANDWVEDKTDTFDLTSVPSLNKNPNSGSNSTQNAGSTGSTKKHAPYLMLSTPASSKSASTNPARTSASPRPNKTRPYDLEISDFEAPNNTEPAKKKNFLSRITAKPAKAIGVTCGVCVGVPVSIARDTRKYTGQMKKSMNDGIGVEKNGDLIGNMFSAACAVPFGFGSGLVHGSVTGVQRAVEHGKTQPFSKESMSLGRDEKSLSNRPSDTGDN